MTHKAAIVGFGGMGQRHFAAYRKRDVEVVGICDWDPARVASAAPGFPGGQIYDSADELIAKVDADIISVVSNGPTHAEIVVKAAQAGFRNIFCEKPIATNLGDAQMVIEACDRHGSRLAVNHIRRWSSNYRRLKELLQSGVIGKPETLYFSCGSTGLGNFTSHFFDVARFLIDSEVETVVGYLDDTGTVNPRGAHFVDPAGFGLVWFENGVRFMVDTSEKTGVQYSFQIVGEYGRISIDELNDSWTVRARDAKGRELPLTRYGEPMPEVPFVSDGEFDIVELTAAGQAQLLAGGELSCTGDDGKKALEIVIAFHLSHAGGNRPVTLPLQGDDVNRDVSIG